MIKTNIKKKIGATETIQGKKKCQSFKQDIKRSSGRSCRHETRTDLGK